VSEQYVNHLPYADVQASRDDLIERHLRIVAPIAGKLAWQRCPNPLRCFGIWGRECLPSLSHIGLIHELTAVGTLGLFIAADRFDPEYGQAFSTYADYWVKKMIYVHLEEIASVVPQTGHMGDDEPRRGFMDTFNAALRRKRLYRGKAAGSRASYDMPLTIPGPNPGDKEIETVGTDGATLNAGMSYLQRRVSEKLYPWADMGTYHHPRLQLPGHHEGRAYDGPVLDEFAPDETNQRERAAIDVDYYDSETGQRISHIARMMLHDGRGLTEVESVLNFAPTSKWYAAPKWRKPVIGDYPRLIPQRLGHDPYDRQEFSPFTPRLSLEAFLNDRENDDEKDKILRREDDLLCAA